MTRKRISALWSILASLAGILLYVAVRFEFGFGLGGGAINDFAFAMVVGLIIGTFSSIFIATPITLAWYRGRRPILAQPTRP